MRRMLMMRSSENCGELEKNGKHVGLIGGFVYAHVNGIFGRIVGANGGLIGCDLGYLSPLGIFFPKDVRSIHVWKRNMITPPRDAQCVHVFVYIDFVGGQISQSAHQKHVFSFPRQILYTH